MFLANENFPAPSIRIIRAGGYPVKSIREEQPGIADEAVIEIAIAQGLIILTFDKDYGEIIFRQKPGHLRRSSSSGPKAPGRNGAVNACWQPWVSNDNLQSGLLSSKNRSSGNGYTDRSLRIPAP